MSSLAWYLNRLSLMSPAEVAHRVRVATRQVLDWPRHRLDRRPRPASSLFRWEGDSLCQAVIGRAGVQLFNLRPETPVPPDISRDDAVAVADRLLAHRFSFFDVEDEFFGQVIQWNYNYRDDKACPLRYAPRINYRDEEVVGEVKYIWELNRHQHLVPLARAYYLTGDERYAGEVVRQILSWIEQCPYLKGINWTSAEQAALRIISWIWAFEWIRSAACVTEAFLESFLRSVFQHLEFITRHYSRFSSANNHLIGEATGVFFATVYFPELRNADGWRAASHRILIEEAIGQNHSDGVNGEHATAYHCLVLEYLLLAGLLGERHGIQFPKRYWQRLERMMEVMAAVMDCRGQLPSLGDDDNGVVVWLGTPSESRARSMLATGAAVFGREDFQALAPEFDERTFWLLRPEDARPRRAPARSVTGASGAFPSGYCVLRSGSTPDAEAIAVFDCAPLGLKPLAAHGHADALSFTLTVAGREILIDPGTYAYHSQRRWRDYFRGTSAHNTIRIDGQDQSVSAGTFMWSHKAEAALEHWESSERRDVARGRHDGYLRLADPVRHRREITFDKKETRFQIVDVIEAKDEHLIEQFFHFSEACEMRQEGREWLIHNDGVRVRLRADDQLQVARIEGQEDPPLGWRSRRLGHKQPSPTLVGRMTGVGPRRLVTLISVEKAASWLVTRDS